MKTILLDWLSRKTTLSAIIMIALAIAGGQDGKLDMDTLIDKIVVAVSTLLVIYNGTNLHEPKANGKE